MSGSAAGGMRAAGRAQEQPGGALTLADQLEALAAQGEQYRQTFSPETLAYLSTGGQTLLELADQADQIDELLANVEQAREQPELTPQRPRPRPEEFANDVYAAEDFFSRMAGMTQN